MSEKPYQLIEGDCLEYLEGLPIPDLVLTDPPYGLLAHEWETAIPWERFWKLLPRRDDTPVCCFASGPFLFTLVQSNQKEYRYKWVWAKPRGSGFLTTKKQPLHSYEEICVFYRKQPTYHPQMIPMERTTRTTYKAAINKNYAWDVKQKKDFTRISKEKYPIDVLQGYQAPGQTATERVHPSQKPVALLRYFIETYSNPGDVVLDPFMGSGSTGVAALELGRRFIGIEKDPAYFKAAQTWVMKTQNEVVPPSEEQKKKYERELDALFGNG